MAPLQYIGTYATKKPVSFGAFKRDVVFFKVGDYAKNFLYSDLERMGDG